MHKPISRFWQWGGILLCVVGLVAFVLLTPPALLRKMDYIGAAVCHRQAEHSFFVAGHQLPLCQRCTGTFGGALTGLWVHFLLLRRRRAQRFPKLWTWGLVAFFFLLWGLDGVNSFTTEQLGRSVLGYAPQPWLRLLTGTFMGMSMSIVLVPAFNQTLWSDGMDEPPLRNGKDFFPLLAIELAQAGLIYLLEPWMLYPIALYTTAGVVMMFILLGSMVWVMALGQDQSYPSWGAAWLPFVWGVVFVMLIIGGMDALRMVALGTIDTMPGLS